MTTGERIKQRRKELCITAEQLADLLEVSPATIYRYEKGDIEKMPSTILEPLSRILMTTPAYLMGWSSTMPEKLVTAAREVVEDKQLLDLFHQLNAQGKANLTNYARFLTSQPEYLEKNSESGNVEERA